MKIEFILITIGSLLMSIGVYFIYPPASLIVMGFLMLKIGWPEGDKK